MRRATVVLLALLLPGIAWAHPHVWIDNRVTFDFAAGKLTALELDWQFDDLSSAPMIEQYDHGAKGHFDAADIAAIRKEVLPDFSDFESYIHVRVDGQEVAIDKVTDFQPSLEDGRVRFRFTIPLPQPVDPAAHEMEAAFYDQTFFVDLELVVDHPVRFEGTGACTDAITHDTAHPIYFGQVIPQLVTISCKPA